jgi:hypothetical protein
MTKLLRLLSPFPSAILRTQYHAAYKSIFAILEVKEKIIECWLDAEVKIHNDSIFDVGSPCDHYDEGI